MTTMATKWNVLQHRLEEAEAQAAKLRRELDGLDGTTFGHPCGGCGEMLTTEGDFARHFTIPDTRYLNLGYCPVEGDRTQRTRTW